MFSFFQNNQGLKFRNELKYIISDNTLQILKRRICNLIPHDSHVGSNGKYIIRSLYFDDFDDRCYYENENGTDPREKFRIRTYNYSDSRISLECKRKENGMTHKSSCRLTKELTEKYLDTTNGISNLLIGSSSPLLSRFNNLVIMGLRPKVIVEYEREPFIYHLGNVRVTFDTNIMSSTQFDSFFESSLAKRPVMPTGYHLLEVKYDEFLPSFIYDTLQLCFLERTAFSKYYLCRKYSL